MRFDDLPPFLRIEQAQEITQLGRSQLYEQTKRWRATGGKEGIPVVRFGRCLRIPKAALLRLAESLYVGDLLEEQPYADWAVAPRAEALTGYLSIAAILGDADSAAGDYELAASRYLRMLERDPYSELAHLGAVRALRSAGHHGPAQRLYRNYVAKMAEIDVEPATFPTG